MAAVQEGPWKSLSSGKKVALVAGLSVGATVGYIMYRHIRSSSAQQQKTEQSRFSVPLDVYRSIARHQSTFLDLISQKSGAQVNVLPNSEDQSAVCFLLQGTPQQNLLAKCALEKLANDSELINDVLEVPQTAFGRIIGRGGETLKLISRTSGARVNCPRERGLSLEEKGKVMITGTRQEVQRAKELIMEKVMENETVRKRISQSSALRQKRKALELEPVHRSQGPDTELMQHMNGDDLLSPLTEVGLIQANGSNGFASSGDHTTENSLRSEEEDICSPASPLEYSKFEIPSPDLSFQPGEHLEVYVSASENPQHFWIQIIGVRSLQLDKLTTEMSRFYNGDTLHEHRVEAIVVGDIVAAPYQDHGTWNRARVLGVLSSGLVDLYYVDFGDNAELPRDQLRSLRSDFLSLPFQAIECSLAEVHPAGDFWTEDALDDFERMTYCAQWKPLLAKLCSYSHTEMSSWPSVKLYDNSQGKAVDLGEELIRLGHAVSCQDEGSGLRGDHDEPRSLQKLLDDMTGATSELSMSCISLSVTKQLTWSSSSCPSSVDVERADVDQNSSDGLMPPSSSLLYSTPSLSLSELVSHVIESSGSVLSPLGSDPRLIPHQSLMSCSDLPSATQVKQMQEFSSVTTSSSSAVDVVTSALDSIILSDNVFFGTFSSSSNVTSSSELMEPESSLSTCSECVCSSSSNSSDGIRGVWYYLTSSRDSSELSLNTTMPTSSTASSSSRPTSSSSCLTESEDTTPVTSSSVIHLSSDLSSSADDAEMTDGDPSEPSKSLQKCSVSYVSECSSGESDVIYIGATKSVSDPSDKGANNSNDSTSKSNVKKQQLLKGSTNELSEHLAEVVREKKEKEEVCEEAMLREKVLDLENRKANSGDVSVREVASISGSVDDVLEDEFN
ncbi:tudor and KH domain-containing protein isoform X2 [Pangasianodon hypophthalmus]|uniref:tudor and KH domain-containing protein isoform X2 n=1 Tax=Pangasianodon hypophthalmus TaxID=310915 RepID=UPI001480A1E6|nr:tudor and KH domain-containing protein isoform X2 [Pangasianodon hypophthalmus]